MIGYPVQIPCFMLLHITQVINSHICSHKVVTVPTTIMSEFQDSENSKDKYKNWYTHKARHYYICKLCPIIFSKITQVRSSFHGLVNVAFKLGELTVSMLRCQGRSRELILMSS